MGWPARPAHPIQNRVFLPTYLVQPLTMPPKRIESSQKAVNQEGKILLALSDIKDSRVKSIRAIVNLYHIPYSTLRARTSGRMCYDATILHSAILYILVLGISALTADIVVFLAKVYNHVTQACVITINCYDITRVQCDTTYIYWSLGHIH